MYEEQMKEHIKEIKKEHKLKDEKRLELYLRNKTINWNSMRKFYSYVLYMVLFNIIVVMQMKLDLSYDINKASSYIQNAEFNIDYQQLNITENEAYCEYPEIFNATYVRVELNPWRCLFL